MVISSLEEARKQANEICRHLPHVKGNNLHRERLFLWIAIKNKNPLIWNNTSAHTKTEELQRIVHSLYFNDKLEEIIK